ncbi:MAG: iron-sulfur cluster carrier protein ApbC [Legionella sp.]|nr:MAG: iron-sulfur cluster carrier protein ApbC [Legionella sp.]
MTLEHTIIHTPDTLLHLSLKDLSLQPEIQIRGNDIHLSLKAPYPIAFLQHSLRDALSIQLPQYRIHIEIEQTIRSHQTQLPGRALRGVKNIIAIGSGKGGVGKSTVAVNLATALSRLGARVGLLDADIYGPSVPLMLGQVPQVQIQDDKYLPISAHGIEAMSIGYLTHSDTALIWRGPMLAKSLIQMLDLTLWHDLDYLCIDLPPGTGDIQLSLVQKIPLAGAIVVTTPQQIATLDAQKALQMFAKTNIHALGIIENMSQHQCSQCGHHESIFGQGGAERLAHEYHCPLLGQFPLDARIGQESDQGQPSALSSDTKLAKLFLNTAMNAAKALSQQPLNYADKIPPLVNG